MRAALEDGKLPRAPCKQPMHRNAPALTMLRRASHAAAQVAGFAAAYDAVGDEGARKATTNFFDIVTQHHRHACTHARLALAGFLFLSNTRTHARPSLPCCRHSALLMRSAVPLPACIPCCEVSPPVPGAVRPQLRHGRQQRPRVLGHRRRAGQRRVAAAPGHRDAGDVHAVQHPQNRARALPLDGRRGVRG